MSTKRGPDLEVGDVICVWSSEHQYRITALEPYSGSLGRILRGARTARLAGGPLKAITIERNSVFEVID